LPLAVGTRIGIYDVTAPIGEGGMGQVFRARDTRLGREVAIKILPEAFAHDTDRLARFQREAKTLASLNHPNIAAVYGLEETGGVTALVMELVDGEDLAQRLTRGKLLFDEALPIAKQIADALEAAHEQGIVHRDLKPANIKVRADGTVKVLDFGLAKAIAAGDGSGGVSLSPTITSPAMTQAGVILGTATYMAPEQARGRTVDRRADIWAFGCVLFEMLSGRRPFDGEDITEVLGAVVRLEPPWEALPSTVPARVAQVLRVCLRKDPRQRAQAIGDVRLALDGAFETTVDMPVTAPSPARTSLWRRAMPVVSGAVVAGAVVGAIAWTSRPALPKPAVVRFSLALSPGDQLTNTTSQGIAVSPDGTQVVYVSNNQLYVRSMADGVAQPIAGTQGALPPGSPVFSPDGKWIAYSSGMNRAINKIAVSGGAPIVVLPIPVSVGRMTWDANGIVFIQAGTGVVRVPPSGGEPEVLVKANENELLYGPQVLPGGEWVLFTRLARATPAPAAIEAWDNAQIVVQAQKAGERKTILSAASDARFLPSGHLVYAVQGTVFAVPFDPQRLVATGGPVPVIEGVRRTTTETASAVTQFHVSDTGTLAYIPGSSAASAARLSIGLFDRTGGFEPFQIQPGPYSTPRMSPDGRRIAFATDDGKAAAIWVYEVSGASAMRRLTFTGQGRSRYPIWSSDSQRVAFQSDREGDLGIFWQRADGDGAAERLTRAEAGRAHIPETWSPDGAHLLFSELSSLVAGVQVLSLKDRTVTGFDAESSSAAVPGPVFSPDGRWVAYASRSGRTRSAVYVQPFPPTGAKYQLSRDADDGHHPVWSPDGGELLFNPGPGPSLFVTRIGRQASFSFAEAPPIASTIRKAAPGYPPPYDMTRDGRLLGLIDASEAQAGASAPQIQIVLGWFEELTAKSGAN
jgi:eukaryotic-like serine/threonine-protein kinase